MGTSDIGMCLPAARQSIQGMNYSDIDAKSTQDTTTMMPLNVMLNEQAQTDLGKKNLLSGLFAPFCVATLY